MTPHKAATPSVLRDLLTAVREMAVGGKYLTLEECQKSSLIPGPGNRLRTALANFEACTLPTTNETIERCAKAARMIDRVGYEWVKDSVWDNITKLASDAVLALATRPHDTQQDEVART